MPLIPTRIQDVKAKSEKNKVCHILRAVVPAVGLSTQPVALLWHESRWP